MENEMLSQEKDGEKEKADYFVWTEEMANELLKLLVEEARNGNRDKNGHFKTYVLSTSVKPILEAKFGKSFTVARIRNKIKTWKRKIEPVEVVMKNNSGFGWDPQSQRFTCSDETWKNYLQAHPKTPPLKDRLFQNFDDYMAVVGNHYATGKGAGGLGANGVEDAPSENIMEDDTYSTLGGEASLDPSQVGSEVPRDTSASPLIMNETVQSMPSGSRKRHKASGAGFSNSPMGTMQDFANEFMQVNKNLQDLVAEMRMMRGRNLPWVDAVSSTPGFSDAQKWMILNDSINQDLKDAFVKMDASERHRFLNWKLTGQFSTNGDSEEETQEDHHVGNGTWHFD